MNGFSYGVNKGKLFFILFSFFFFLFESDRKKYRISAYSFRGIYSFLNLTLCRVTFGHSTYRCGNYSREETIQGRKLFAEIRYASYIFSESGFETLGQL